MEADSSAKVQHVNKKYSDELLRKFSCDTEDDIQASRNKLNALQLAVSKRRKRSIRVGTRDIDIEQQYSDSPLSNTYGKGIKIVAEQSSLLPAPSRNRKSVLLWQMGIHGRSHFRLRARDFRNKSLLGTIEKSWHRTMEGASKVFIGKHYSRHKRLISDMV